MEHTTITKIPKHVALIMDGNRRWARQRNLAEVDGHRQGVAVIKPLIQRAFDLGIEVLTFWAFSTKNFRRDPGFIKGIMQVFRETLDKREWFDEITEAGGEIRIIGDPQHFPGDIRKKMEDYLQKNRITEKRGVVNFAIEYEGRHELLRAIRKMADEKMDLENVTEEMVSSHLDTAGLPDPDLMIRTGGDQRLSGYLLWQVSDAELYFTNTLWPDFTVEKFDEALVDFANRERRFGK